MPAEHHSVAAVFSRPRTFILSRMMTPAPRKLIETICAAILPGLSGDVVMELHRIKTAAPVATSALVRNPAIR